MEKGIRKYIGDKAFYRMIMFVALPIMCQNALTSVVDLLDKIMVGRLGIESATGVNIVGNLFFVFIIVCFGAVSGAGIFCAQFFGKGDYKGMASAFRMKLYIVSFSIIFSVVFFSFLGESVISLYLHDVEDGCDVMLTATEAWKYMRIMIWGLPFLAVSMCYSSTMREGGQTFVPMIAGLIAVITDFTFNFLLIFGKFGFPRLGVEGAAIATVLSRITECFINVIYTHVKSGKLQYIKHVFTTFKIEKTLLKNIAIKGTPLFVNESLWVLAMTFVTQCYSERGVSALGAINIDQSIANVFNIFFLAMGSAVSIVVGQLLGSNKIDEAKATTRKMVACTFAITVVTGILMALGAKAFPLFYNYDDSIRNLATKLILVHAIFVPFGGICHSAYFALRSGGKTWLTLVFDSGFQWVVCVPVAFFLARYTTYPIIIIYTAVFITDVVKCFLSILFLKKTNWAQNIVQDA